MEVYRSSTSGKKLFVVVRDDCGHFRHRAIADFNIAFIAHYRFHKICNKSNIIVGYSSMPKMFAVISNHNKKLLSTCRRPIDPHCPSTMQLQNQNRIHNAIAESKPPAFSTWNANRNQLYIKQKYPLTILPNYIMDPILMISKRDLVITSFHLLIEIKEMQPSYQKKSGERRILVLSHQLNGPLFPTAPSY